MGTDSPPFHIVPSPFNCNPVVQSGLIHIRLRVYTSLSRIDTADRSTTIVHELVLEIMQIQGIKYVMSCVMKTKAWLLAELRATYCIFPGSFRKVSGVCSSAGIQRNIPWGHNPLPTNECTPDDPDQVLWSQRKKFLSSYVAHACLLFENPHIGLPALADRFNLSFHSSPSNCPLGS